MAWVERPAKDDLERAVGYVQYVAVEQMDGRDSVVFRLEEFRQTYGGGPRDDGLESESRKFAIYLDVGTTVALAQLQLLREAMVRQYAVALYFLDDTGAHSLDDDLPDEHEVPTGFRFAYEVMVIPVPFRGGVITAATVQW